MAARHSASPSAPDADGDLSKIAMAAVTHIAKAQGLITLVEPTASEKLRLLVEAIMGIQDTLAGLVKARHLWADVSLTRAAAARAATTDEHLAMSHYTMAAATAAGATAPALRAAVLAMKQGTLDIRVFAQDIITKAETVNTIADVTPGVVPAITPQETFMTFICGISDPLAKAHAHSLTSAQRWHALDELADAIHTFVESSKPSLAETQARTIAQLEARVRAAEGKAGERPRQNKDRRPAGPSTSAAAGPGEYSGLAVAHPMAAVSEHLPRPQRPPVPRRSPPSCYNCGKPGHAWRQCPEPMNDARVMSSMRATQAVHGLGAMVVDEDPPVSAPPVATGPGDDAGAPVAPADEPPAWSVREHDPDPTPMAAVRRTPTQPPPGRSSGAGASSSAARSSAEATPSRGRGRLTSAVLLLMAVACLSSSREPAAPAQIAASFPPTLANVTNPTWNTPVGTMVNTMIDSGTLTTWLAPEAAQLLRARGLTGTDEGPPTTLSLQHPHFPPLTLEGHWVSVLATARSGAQRVIRAFVAPFHGEFTRFGMIIGGPNATALGISADTGDETIESTAPDPTPHPDPINPPSSPHPLPPSTNEAAPNLATRVMQAARGAAQAATGTLARLVALAASAVDTSRRARDLVWVETDDGAALRGIGHSGQGRWASLSNGTAPTSTTHDPQGPAGGRTRALVGRNGSKLAEINAYYTATTTSHWQEATALISELVAALEVGAQRPLIRSHDEPVIVPPSAEALSVDPNLFRGRTYPMSAADLSLMDTFVTKAIADGTIEPMEIPGGILANPPGRYLALVPMFVTPTDRPVADMRRVNAATDTSSLRHTPVMADQVAHAAASGCFLITDCSKAFYSVRTSTDASKSIVTTFWHRSVLYRYRVLVMGGALSPGLFCARMEHFCTTQLGPGSKSYVDDVVSHLPEPAIDLDGRADIRPALKEAIRIVKEFSSDNGFRMNPDKTVILAGSAVCCGRQVGSGSIGLSPDALASALVLEPPQVGADCARIAGILNAMAQCVPGLGAIAGRISQAGKRGCLRAMAPAERDAVDADVRRAAEMVTQATAVWVPSRGPNTRFVLYHDASRDGFGWVLAEYTWPGPGPIPDIIPAHMIPADDSPALRIVSIGSRATRGREKFYSAVDLELGGARTAYRACKHHLQHAARYVSVSDNRPWVLAFAGQNPKQKFLRIIAEISANAIPQVIHCRGGLENPLTDALSRSFHGRRPHLGDTAPVYLRPAPSAGTVELESLHGYRWPEEDHLPMAAVTRAAAAALPATDEDEDDDDYDYDEGEDVPTAHDNWDDGDDGGEDEFDPEDPEDGDTDHAPALWAEDPSDENAGSDGEGDDLLPPRTPTPWSRSDAHPRDLARIRKALPFITTTGQVLPAVLTPDAQRRYFPGAPRQDPGPGHREALISYHHARGHVGTQAVCQAVLDGGNDWHGMFAAVRTHCSLCPTCQVWNPHAPAVNEYPVDIYSDVTPGAHLCMDVTHMTTSPDGFKMILVVMDVATRFKFALPLRAETTEEICAALDLVLGINGPCARVSCDNNVVFTGAAVAAVAARHGAAIDTTSEYSKANRCEIACKAVGDAVRKASTASGSATRWRVLLSATVSAINAAVTHIGSLDAWISPFEAYFARCNRLALPTNLPANPDLVQNDHVLLRRHLDLIYQHDVVNTARAQAYSSTMAHRRARYETENKVTVFPPGTAVLVHRHARAPKWKRRWEGPYTVLHRSYGGAYTLLDRNNRVLGRRFVPQLLKRWRGPIEHAAEEDELESIISHTTDKDGRVEYTCSWLGYGQDQNTLEGVSSFHDPWFLEAYHASSTRPFYVASYQGNMAASNTAPPPRRG